MTKNYILAIDQGTTGSTVAILDRDGRWISSENQDFPQIFPKSGWVEHDPNEIWQSIKSATIRLFSKTKIDPRNVASIGITNQRETIVAWDSRSGQPIYNAIVWQCRRTNPLCQTLKKKGFEKIIRKKTGLVLDPYFSATKIVWILKNVDASKQLHKMGWLRVGTVDSYLLWKLTNGAAHKTEVSNASRTMLMNLETLDWDQDLLKLFNIPRSILPSIESSANLFGHTRGLDFLPDDIPICGILGDQQAALFGQACYATGTVKCTFGTGSFILLNTGDKITKSKHGMLTTVAWKIGNKVTYALEGGAFVCGAAVHWLRDGLGIIDSASEVEKLAEQVPDCGGVEFIPALTGLGAPYWAPEVRGEISGISRGTTKAHIARATLEAMALQNVDILEAMEKDLGKKIRVLSVDGGATSNNLLMQIQSDLLGKKVIRPSIIETTAYGAGLIAGLGSGFWGGTQQISELWQTDKEFRPVLRGKLRNERVKDWRTAVGRMLT